MLIYFYSINYIHYKKKKEKTNNLLCILIGLKDFIYLKIVSLYFLKMHQYHSI